MLDCLALKEIGIIIGIALVSRSASSENIAKRPILKWPQEPVWVIRYHMRVANTTEIPKAWNYQDTRPQCEGYISVFNSWGWGNQMLELFSLFGNAINFGKTKLLLKASIRDKFGKVFPALRAIPSVEEVPCQMNTYLQIPFPASTKLNKTLNLLTKRFAENTETAMTYRKEILQLFEFNQDIKELVHQIKFKITESQRKKMSPIEGISISLVGIHCRRTDYIDHLRYNKALGITEHYFYKAMEIMRMKHGPNIAFIVTTDDLLWVKEKFGQIFNDVYFSIDYYSVFHEEAAVVDFALLTSLDHIILSPGTFSFAAGYFVDGDVIVPDCRFHGLVLSPMRALTTLLCPRWYSLADPSFFTVPHLNSVVDT